MQLHSSGLNLLIRLQFEVGLRRQLRQVRILELQLAVELEELVEPLLEPPLASAKADVDHVKDNLIASFIYRALKVWQFNL